MTCFFPCGGAVLKTEGTSAQPTAVAPPPARQLGAAGEPPMPAPSRQGATTSPSQVRLGGKPPNRPRSSAVGLPAGQTAQTKGTRQTGSGAARGSYFARLCLRACVDTQPGRRLSSEHRFPRGRLQPSAAFGGEPRRSTIPGTPARHRGGSGKRWPVWGGACRGRSLCLVGCVLRVCLRGNRGGSARRRAEV